MYAPTPPSPVSTSAFARALYATAVRACEPSGFTQYAVSIRACVRGFVCVFVIVFVFVRD